MKSKPVFIIIGSLVIFVLILVWVYFLFFGPSSDTEESNTTLPTGGQELIDENLSEEDKLEANKAKLRQLTTREVAGFREVNANGSPTVYYIEKGTGHMYSLNLITGADNRISGTTIPGTFQAEISPKGDYVAIATKSNTKNTHLVVGNVSSSSDISTKEIGLAVDQFSIGDGEELLYTTRDEEGLVGHSYKFSTGLIKDTFNIPFHEAIIDWGENSNDTHYFYPKASYLLEGYLYEVNNKKISRLPVDGFGLTALGNNGIIAYSEFNKSGSHSGIYDQDTRETKSISVVLVPEKCAFQKLDTLICGFERTDLSTGFPDNWYQGTVNFKDSLWSISATDGSATLLVNTEIASGRQVDVTNMTIDDSGYAAYFINKNDNTLWMYEL